MSENKKTLIISIVAVVLFIIAITAASYAFYTAKTNAESKGIEINSQTAKVETTLEDDGELNVTIIPGDSFTKTFKITNNGPEMKYYIAVLDLQNSFINSGDIKYVLTEENDGEEASELKNGTFPKTATNDDGSANLSDLITLPSGASRTYKLTITYENDPKRDQQDDMGNSISGKIFIRGE